MRSSQQLRLQWSSTELGVPFSTPMRTPQVSLASPKVKLAGSGDGAQVPGQDGAAVRTFRVLYLDEVSPAARP
jgi:hypothetical protein